jgi:hypothetical protein
MLLEFLSLYLRVKFEKIVTNSILLLILFFWLIPFDILLNLEWYFYLFFSIIFFLILYLLIIRRIKRTCIMLDSKLSRETYLEGVGLEPLKRN